MSPLISPRDRAAGFTLLELLVALAIFALLAVMSYAGLSKVLHTEQILDNEMERLTEIQRSVAFMSRDIQQTVDRPIRDAYGDPQPAIAGSTLLATADSPVLELTRNGYTNAMGVNRSTLQRVAYRVVDHTLLRDTWRVLDRAQGSEPDSILLCADVNDLKVRYLDHEQNWHDQWPPLDSQYQGPALPLAVEVTLELDDWGDIVRLLPVAAEV
jgi:general secretion pathway protein J